MFDPDLAWVIKLLTVKNTIEPFPWDAYFSLSDEERQKIRDRRLQEWQAKKEKYLANPKVQQLIDRFIVTHQIEQAREWLI